MEKNLPERIEKATKTFTVHAPLRLMFQDEARFGLISDVRSCWSPYPVRPMCDSSVAQEYIYAYGAVSILDGKLDSLVLPSVNTECMEIFLDEIGRRYRAENVVMVLDGAGWHRSKALRCPENVRLLYLPPYSPELNPVEHIWDDLREKSFHNRVFKNIDALEDHLVSSLGEMENDVERVPSIVSWDWIIKSLSFVIGMRLLAYNMRRFAGIAVSTS